jgi:CheY-like chemotaxis protein
VAEDNEFNAQLLEQLLERRGHQVNQASNGREALALAEKAEFDVLLLDIHMPEMDGFQVIKAIRERERVAGGHLPVIALTSQARKEDREQCLAAGMDDFVAKPIEAATLWETMERVLRRDEGRGMRDEKRDEGGMRDEGRPIHELSFDAKERQTAGGSLLHPNSPLSSGSSLIPHPSSLHLLDAKVLLASCGCDDAILEKISQAFRIGLPNQLAAVLRAVHNRDAKELREAAHKLCGMVSAFSTVAASEASELEDRAAGGQLDDSAALAKRLEAICQELIGMVEGLSVDALRQQAQCG